MTSTSFSFVMRPPPLQLSHGCTTTVPRPLQRWQTRSTAIGRRPCWNRTRPRAALEARLKEHGDLEAAAAVLQAKFGELYDLP